VTQATIATALTLLAAGVNALAAALGALRWWQVRHSRAFWALARCGQGAAALTAAGAGVLALAGFQPATGLFWLYALLPVAIGLIAEQLRVSAAEQVLELRGLAQARDMERLPDDVQRSIVLQVVRREMGVMTLAAGTVCFLAARAAFVV
jgi:hypothetical protein